MPRDSRKSNEIATEADDVKSLTAKGDDLWTTIKNHLKLKSDEDSYQKWIEPLEATREGPNEFLVRLPNLVFYQGLHNNFLDQVEQLKSDLGFDNFIIRFEVLGLENPDEILNSHFKSEGNSNEELTKSSDSTVSYSSDNDQQHAAFSRCLTTDLSLNSLYTFDSFVRGDSNQFAAATCLSAGENPGMAYNPLFIYGSSGLGKTHLLHAVGNLVMKNNPGAVVTYISSERFMNEMIYCLRFAKMWDFRQKYRNCDVFLVDDIQFISGKKATQEEFFHTFNSLYAAKKQIVITSDLFPKDIPDIEDRLRNRFQWGLIADIQPPSVEHRIAILHSKAEKLGLELDNSVAEYIAKHAKRNVRELEGALLKINAVAKLQGEEITYDLATKLFKDIMLPQEASKGLAIDQVQKAVADRFKIRVADLRSKRRQKIIAFPRQIAMYLSRKLTSASYPEIGEKFGGKDHTTILHAVKKIEEALDTDLDLRAHIEALERYLEQMEPRS
jgi:chromosomal replication initiator protein